VLERTIDVHIKSLRKKLGAWDFIEAVRGVGYRFRGISDAAGNDV
jgi:two-component system phosphate regulon response regulator PhoB